MTPTTARLDAVDRAFLWHADQARWQPRRPLQPPAREEGASLRESNSHRQSASPTAPASTVLPPEPDASVSIATEPVSAGGAGTLVDRLLRLVPQSWDHLAQRVEDAHRGGAEVIAVTGARHGEGRTTMVECLVRTLAARGRRVERLDRVPAEPPPAERDTGSIVIVDAGVWFPGGPIRRAWLERQSLGCHAVILVRRADQPPCEARASALEAVGLTVLGEVLTMVPPATGGIRVS